MRLESKKELMGNDSNLIEILSQAWGYFDIAAARFCDNIVMIIQTTLVSCIHNEIHNYRI